MRKIKKNQLRHAQQRCVERYQVELSKALLKEIVGKIQSGTGVFLHRTSLTRTLWKVETSKGTLKVVYNKATKSVVTVLPLEKKSDGRET